jgi:hypothetical protein
MNHHNQIQLERRRGRQNIFDNLLDRAGKLHSEMYENLWFVETIERYRK